MTTNYIPNGYQDVNAIIWGNDLDRLTTMLPDGRLVWVADSTTPNPKEVIIWNKDGTISFPGNVSFAVLGQFTAVTGQTIVSTGNTYVMGTNTLEVYVNGLRQTIGSDYTETSSSTITFTSPLQLNDKVSMFVRQFVPSGLTAIATPGQGGTGLDSSSSSGQPTIKGGVWSITPHVIDANSYGASPSANASVNTAAIQAAINAVDPLIGASIILAPGVYSINGRLTISQDNTVLCGGGYHKTELSCTTADSGITISKGGVNLIYACSLNDIVIDGNDIATTGLLINNLTEASFHRLFTRSCTTGIEFTGDLSVIINFFESGLTYGTTGMKVTGTLSHCVMDCMNCYDLTTVFDLKVINQLILQNSWIEKFMTLFSLTNSVTENATVDGLRVKNNYFLSTLGGVGLTARLLKIKANNAASAVRLRSATFEDNFIILYSAKYLFESEINANFSITDELDLKISRNWVYSTANLTAMFSTDATNDWIQDVKFYDNSTTIAQYPLKLTDVPQKIALTINGIRSYVSGGRPIPAAGVESDGLVIIEDNGVGDRNLVFYYGGQRFRVDGGAAI